MTSREVETHVEEPTFGNYFVAAYPPFSKWSEVAVADFERVLDSPPSQAVPLGLYCHIPFCIERCSYCYYLSHAGRQLERVDEYVTALIAELRSYAARPVVADRPLDFVYFGGGTPSILSTARIGRLLEGLQEILPWSKAREVTFECAPRSVTLEKMQALRDAGVTRLSLGVQQLDDEVLRLNGRVHMIADVEAAFAAVQKVGFDVVNLDLMIGLVGETGETVQRTLERVLQMAPDCVTVYQLEIPFNTPLCRDLRDGRVDPPPASWPEKHARLQDVFALLAAGGYRPISAYAAVRDPDVSFVYQDALYHGADLLGIGVSSFGYIQGVHHQNNVRLDDYLAALAEPRLPFHRAYALSKEERAVRELVLQLKLGRVDCDAFRKKHGVELLERFAAPLDRFEALGWLRSSRKEIELTPKGIPRADRMLPAFYLPDHRVARYS
jgi:oxygen-independent coproporphyrinogen-3 oxidase